jgi:uncharacterized protein (TIGR04255 family)
MPEICHLSRAPIVEALVNFQANAARLWNPENVRPALSACWPEYAEIQELRPVQIEVKQTPQGQLPPEVTFPAMEGFIFRSKTLPVVHQARRNGYTFSRLEPYEDWNSLEVGAITGWTDYKGVLEPEDLHAVAVRFINRVKFPLEGFKLARYFTTPPIPPPDLGWQFHGFMHESLYAVPDSPCVVKVIIAPAFDGALPEALSFIIDIEVTLKESLPALGKSMEAILEEMHNLKNKAFFNLLTEETIQAYK